MNTIKLTTYFHAKLLKPTKDDADERRLELIVNVLVCGLIIFAVVALLASLGNHFVDPTSHKYDLILNNLIFLVIAVAFLRLSRIGYARLVAYIMLFVLFLSACYLAVGWSFELPQAILLFTTTIVMSGILLSSNRILVVAGICSVFYIMLAYLQVYGYLHPDLSWFSQPLQVVDAVGYVAIYCILGLVSWLFNREISSSLNRARSSEVALQEERDNLEIKVGERTKELEISQLARLEELQRFAEFGRINANLLHELANPLTAASLNLEEYSKGTKTFNIVQLRMNLRRLEDYLSAARKQIQGESKVVKFSVRPEIKQVIGILKINATRNQVRIVYKQPANFYVNGDPVKFSQAVGNLIVNAIESYEGSSDKKTKRRVEVNVAQARYNRVMIEVKDHGRGISNSAINHLFDPFFTTKAKSVRGLGIGLAMVKNFIEKDFKGKVDVKSSSNGTTFTISIPLAKK